MKKALPKPQNWQDFESLCKKLWGELWEIPHEIKKNGRLGQPQSGVDVYGIPKEKSNYFGIQAKGKDNYTYSQLTTKEVDEEIQRANTFKPELEEYIFATTANKDVRIEEYIRIKDIESRKKGGFKILLFDWDDITDLIEENRETFNWYVNENKFRDKFNIEIFVNELNRTDDILSPKFLKTSTIYMIGEEPNLQNYLPLWLLESPTLPFFASNKTNHTWCNVDIIIANTGSVVIEDWKLILEISKNVESIDDNFDYYMAFSNKLIKNRTTYVYDEEKIIQYHPVNNQPLIQKDNRVFNICIKPFPKQEDITINWELLARNFNKEGIITLKNTPNLIEKDNIIWVDSFEEKGEDKIEITDYITENKKE
jgi:hypothetical protein